MLNKTFEEVREVISFVTFAALTLALVLFTVTVYNRMVRMRNLVDEGWSGIDVQLKRRSDLVGNLVETVKGYATHEKELFTRVTEARAAARRPPAWDSPSSSVKGDRKQATVFVATG